MSYVEFQILSLTNRIQKLSSYLELHKIDYLSHRGLCKILEIGQQMLSYLSKKNSMHSKKLNNQLGIQE